MSSDSSDESMQRSEQSAATVRESKWIQLCIKFGAVWMPEAREFGYQST